ncbi:MAG: hypothetical protein HOV94_27450, partial [Saccharothrix sp.]|nr:hypothetical protein [Saccharothrix sp.]
MHASQPHQSPSHDDLDGEDVFPASKSQAQLYFVQSTLGSAPTYHVPLFLRPDGPVDVAALRAAVALVVSRHEALRTRFRPTPTGLMQVVDHDARVELAVDRAVPDLRAWMRSQAERPFDLHAGPLFRAAYVEDGPLLSLCFHHSVCDGWSGKVVLDEITRAYADFADGGEPKLPEVDFQFGDYALWHNEWLEGVTAERQLRYWETALSGELPVLSLPPDAPPGAAPEGSGRTFDWAPPRDSVR